jgi:riboflavin kinase/FMN adenylyltransferase
VITFRENPKKFLGGVHQSSGGYHGDIFTLEQKLEVFAGLGIRYVVLIDFSAHFSKLRGQEFTDLLEKRVNLAFLAVGCNFRCGYRQDTDAGFIKKMNESRGVPTEILPPVMYGGFPVSSSRIRSAVLAGDLKTASAMLGRNVELDLRGIGERKDGGAGRWFFNSSLFQRIVPRAGKYEARIKTGGPGFEALVDVTSEGVFIPFDAGSGAEYALDPAGAVSAEFLSSSQ